jgi:AsmA protein
MRSYASLAIEANGVSFAATPRLSPIGKIEAKTVTATLRVRALLRGRIEFATVTVDSGRFVFDRSLPASKPPLFGLETAGAAAAFADLSRFQQLVLHDCAFFTAEGRRRPYSRWHVERVRLAKRTTAAPPAAPGGPPGAPAPLVTLYLVERGFEAYFQGNLNPQEQKAQGSFSMAVSPDHPAADKITAAIVPWEKGQSVSLAGDLTWSGSRAVLDRASAVFGGHRAKGSLAVATRRGRALLEGTLAFDQLDWESGGPETAAESGEFLKPLRDLTAARTGRDGGLDLDMRISAERIRAGQYEAGPVALALTARPDRISIDIAELALFGGTISGRLDYDPVHPEILTLNAGGARLNFSPVTAALGWPFSLSGPATIRLDMKIPLKEQPLVKEIAGATGNFVVRFPSGGSFEGEAARITSASELQDSFRDSGSIPFSTASVEGSLVPSGLSLKIDGEQGDSRIGGTLRISLPGSSVSGTLSLSEAAESWDASSQADTSAGRPSQANLTISGTVAALNVSLAGRPNLSN